MSQNKGNGGQSGYKPWVRMLAMVLCLLMILSCATILIIYLSYGSNAAELPDDQKIRVGLMYGSGVTVGFETTSEYGFTVGSVDADNNFTYITQVTDSLVSVTCDSNLTKKASTYSVTKDADAAVGGYHVEVSVDSGLAQWLELLQSVFKPLGCNVFRCWINGAEKIRVGQFTTYEAAQSILASVSQYVSACAVVSPSDTAVSVINPETDEILFEYDGGGVTQLGFKAVQSGSDVSYLVTPAKNKYEGVFEYARYISGSTDGVRLVNILTLDEYVEGVLPWEISNEWPIEVQKAFAVTVRTFALSMLGRHSDYGFDMCNNTHCQAFMGVGRTNSMVRQAVSETSGMVLTYEGKAAKTYYSAVTGGVTISASEAWGGTVDYPYLQAVATPWENYAGHSEGEWTVEITPLELLAQLQKKGYTNLTGAIADVHIDSFCTNSSYVYSITFTDINGNQATIKTADKIRTTLSAYINSANFVVAKAGETVQITDYSLATDIPITAPDSSAADASTDSGGSAADSGKIYVITSEGVQPVEVYESITVNGSDGTATVTGLSRLTVLTADGAGIYDMTADEASKNAADTSQPASDSSAAQTQTTASGELADLSDIRSLAVITTTRTVTAEGTSGNFVFIGRGWGHGVGISQYGAMNLAELGYDYDDILCAYFPGTKILPVSELIQ